MPIMTRIAGVPDKSEIRAGMAHWEGSGPAGATCGQCTHFEKFKIRPRAAFRCRQFRKLTGRNGPEIFAHYRACRHFA
jgi:hypothetical protein